jgi:hypothetical protein
MNARIRQLGIGLILVACLWLSGCAKTRSISNAAFDPSAHPAMGYRVGNAADPGFEYRGELNEFDVLGVDRSHAATEEEIAQALQNAQDVELKPGGRVLLVQSGAVFPDGPMLLAMERHFAVVPFSGVPPRRRTAQDPEPGETSSYARSLRLAAARAGAETIVCYWGTLESARRKMESKTVSWVPIAGWMVPDEAQHMRIRLKLAVVDVRTGNWRMMTPEPLVDKAWSTAFTRGSSDRKQVELLKEKAYEASVQRLAQRTP